MTDYIQPGVPISQQQQQQSQANQSPFAPSEMEMDIMSGKFDRNAYNMASQEMEAAKFRASQPQQREVLAQPAQNESPKYEINSGFLSNVEKRLAEYRQAAQQQAVQPAPQVVQQPVITQPQAPVQEPIVPQNDTAQKEKTAEDEWLQSLLGGTNKPATTPEPDPTQPKVEQKEDFYNLRKEEADKLTSYLNENQKYFNAIEHESRRRGVDPLTVAEALAKKPIQEVVDFALGNYNRPPQVQPQQPVQVPVQMPAQQQQRQLPDAIDLGRQFNNKVQVAQEPVYSGDKNWGF